jgi:hypothetical protein
MLTFTIYSYLFLNCVGDVEPDSDMSFDDIESLEVESNDSWDENDDAEYWENNETDVIDADQQQDISSSEKTDSQEIVSASLRNWAIDSRIPLAHVSSLLKLLNSKADLTYLPLCASTLLRSKRGKLLFYDVPPGKYYHCGVKAALYSVLVALESKGIQIPLELKLLLNVDGIPISKSSTSEFWPILFRIFGRTLHF